MENRLQGGKAFITGINSFVGCAIGNKLAKSGVDIVGAYFPGAENTGEGITVTREQIAAHKHVFELIQLDQTNPESIAHGLREAEHILEGLDFLVTVASRQSPESFLEMSPDEMEQQVRVNLVGTMRLVQAAAKRMIELGRKEDILRDRSIGVMGSIRGRYSLKFDAYEASKAALHHMVAGLAAELGQYNISINAVAPGTVDSPIEWDRYGSAEAYGRAWGGATPLKRSDGSLATPEDVADTMAFLLSSGRITGETVVLDGGYNRSHPLPIDQEKS